MRLTTDFYVSVLVRRVFADGAFAAVMRRGNAEAGSVFIVVADRDGTRRLYGPAPQAAAPEDGARAFMLRADAEDGNASVDLALAGEIRFDPDLWIVELESLARPLAEYVTIV